MKKLSILLLALVFIFTSCSEDIYIAPENPHIQKITSFTVKNLEEAVEAVILEENKEIVLVLPYYLGLVALELDIQTSEGYTLIDKPENILIEDVREYLLNKKAPLIYGINDKNGNTINYILKIKTYQPEITVPEKQPRNEFRRTAKVDYGDGLQLYENSAYIKSLNIIKRVNGSEITRVFFIDAENNEYELINVSTSRTGITGYFPEGMPVGDYTIRIENYSKAVTLQKVFKLVKAYGEI